MSTGRKTEENGKTNSKGIVKRCTLIRRRREKHKKNRTLQKKGDQQFTDECRKDVVLQARTQMFDNMVNGPKDTIVREVIKQLLLENT